MRDRGLGQYLSEMLGPFGPPPWFFDRHVSNPRYADCVTLVILAGLARPGDTPEQIKANLETAKLYAKTVEDQYEAGYKVEELKRKIRDLEEVLKEARGDIETDEKRLASLNEELSEIDRILTATFGSVPESPKTEMGKSMLENRLRLVQRVAERKEFLAAHKERLEDVEKRLGALQAVLI